jgi:hypothetical protein
MVKIHDATSETPLAAKCIAARDITFSNAAALPGWTFRQRQVMELDIQHSARLTEIPDAISCLSVLRMLRVAVCTSLTRLPSTLVDLNSLALLQLYQTGITCLPNSFGQLCSLVTLAITLCPIQQLPSIIGNLVKLQYLSVTECDRLDTIPSSIGQCRSLRHFTLLHTLVTRLPWSMSALLPRMAFNYNGYFGLVSPLVRSLCELERFFSVRQNILILIVVGRRSRRRRLPPELWALIMSDFL